MVFFEMDTFFKFLGPGRQWQRALHLPLEDSADGGLDAALSSFVRVSRGPAKTMAQCP